MNVRKKALDELIKLVEDETVLREVELFLERAMVLLRVAEEERLSKELSDFHWKIYQARLLRNRALYAKKEALAKSIEEQEDKS